MSAALSIAVAGQGPDLALIHGWGYDSSVFATVADRLAARCRVHLVDLPGYGRNRELAVLPLPELADRLREALPAGTTLCGWSLGGQVALSALAKSPRHFPRLALVSSTPRFVSNGDWPHGIAPVLLTGFARALKADAAGLMSRFGTLVNQGDVSARELTRLLAGAVRERLAGPEALAQGLDWLRDLDFRPLLGKIGHPVLLMHGAHDPLIPLTAAQAAAAMLPNGRLAVFPAAAHVPFLSDPDGFAGQLGDFVHQVAASAC